MAKRSERERAQSGPDEALTLARGATLWSIARGGTRVVRARGVAAGRARVTLRRCASVQGARELVARAIAAKLDAGFRPAPCPPGWPARRLPAVASSAAHERAVRRAGDASAAFVEYGRWLRAQGDPRGALVAADADAAPAGGVVASGCHVCDANAAWFRRPNPRARRDRPPWWPSADALGALDPLCPRAGRHRALLDRYGRHVLGRRAGGDEWLRFGWRLGFIEAVHLAHPGDDGDRDGGCAALRRALRLPAARFARVVDLAMPTDYDSEPLFSDGSFVGDALRGRPVPSVVSLSLGAWLDYADGDDPRFPLDEGWGRGAAPVLGEIGAAAARAFPRLEHLSVAGRGVGLDGLDFGRLRHAAFELARPEEEALDAIARAGWHRLRSLRLSLGGLARPEHASDVAAQVVAFIESRRAPALRHLRLERVPLTDELCDAVGRSPMAEGLVSLEIVRGEMTADGAEALLRHRQRFPRLRALVVAQNALPDEALEALAAGFGRQVEVLAGEQRDGYADDGDAASVVEEGLRARGRRAAPLGGPAPDDDDGADDIDGLLDAAVVLTSLKEAVDRDGEADENDDDEAAGGAAGVSADAAHDPARAADDDEAWPLGAGADAFAGGDGFDDDGEPVTDSRRRRKRDRLAARAVPRTATGR